VVEHAAEGFEQDVRWLDRLIEAERPAPLVDLEVVAEAERPDDVDEPAPSIP
jgi:hypothetical protein